MRRISHLNEKDESLGSEYATDPMTMILRPRVF
jgi:hypothetical protein